MRSGLVEGSHFVVVGLLLAGYGCGSSEPAVHDAALGTGGGISTGGQRATGGTPSTGSAGTGGSAGSGGSTAAFTSPVGTGGSAGKTGAGGAVGTGGATSTGGTSAYDAGGTTYDSSTGDGPATTTSCSCDQQVTTLDCYCQAFGCTGTLAAYGKADGGANYGAIMEYANCNLVAVMQWTVYGSYLWEYYDMTTGRLVGAEIWTRSAMSCPFGIDGGNLSALKAGQLRDASCVRSKCTEGNTLDACMPVPDGGRPAG
jgi:hypothetical protein